MKTPMKKMPAKKMPPKPMGKPMGKPMQKPMPDKKMVGAKMDKMMADMRDMKKMMMGGK